MSSFYTRICNITENIDPVPLISARGRSRTRRPAISLTSVGASLASIASSSASPEFGRTGGIPIQANGRGHLQRSAPFGFSFPASASSRGPPKKVAGDFARLDFLRSFSAKPGLRVPTQTMTKGENDEQFSRYECSKCAGDDKIDIAATLWVRATDDGTDADASSYGGHDYTPKTLAWLGYSRRRVTVFGSGKVL
jgi:hypothetical protein